jgi:hypothetical protein
MNEKNKKMMTTMRKKKKKIESSDHARKDRATTWTVIFLLYFRYALSELARRRKLTIHSFVLTQEVYVASFSASLVYINPSDFKLDASY